MKNCVEGGGQQICTCIRYCWTWAIFEKNSRAHTSKAMLGDNCNLHVEVKAMGFKLGLAIMRNKQQWDVE
jgi:hypothetical protein